MRIATIPRRRNACSRAISLHPRGRCFRLRQRPHSSRRRCRPRARARRTFRLYDRDASRRRRRAAADPALRAWRRPCARGDRGRGAAPPSSRRCFDAHGEGRAGRGSCRDSIERRLDCVNFGRYFYGVTVLELTDAVALLPEPFVRWVAGRGCAPRAHQLELLAKARAGRSVLLIAPTGAGKTLAGFLPSLVELSAASRAAERPLSPRIRPA